MRCSATTEPLLDIPAGCPGGFTPKTGNYHLVVAHHKEPAPAENKEMYEELSYAATLTVFVPEKCPCCGDCRIGPHPMRLESTSPRVR
ncbi:MAG TPA: hypothetical protein VKE74_01300 [Gemmataceae bacterium]|nr:hypothetical protein [Gemmataceae bacterium]